VHCHLAKRPVAPAERLRDIPDAISAIIMKLLAKRAEDRYQTAAGLESDLRRCQIEWRVQHSVGDFPLGERDTPDRLLIPEKLYGRRLEVETLLAAFDRMVNGGAPELILVSGYSGIGKSSLINELQPLLIPRGLFASGKFDQYKRDIPYSTLAQAFQNLMRPLLGKSEGDLARWRDALQVALGPNAGLIADLVPELKLIIGEPPPVPELAPQDAQRRFQLVFRQFIGAFARPEHPLALFLDDLQWLDAATLDVLEDLLSRSDLRNLLLIGAYRDNEVTAAHPLMRKLDAIKAAGGKVEKITLEPLARAHIGELIADTLHCEPEHGAPLAKLVHQKTGGNPFFAIQFVSSLAEERMLTFDHHAARWSWDLNRIHAKGYSGNVVDLLVAKLARLPAKTQLALQQMACLGNAAEVTMHAMVLGTSPDEVHAAQSEAVRQELVVRLDGSYKFVHDRVQEAAYSLIPPGLRAEAHIAIGRLLAANIPAETREEAIFEIVNHLNRGATLITEPDERDRVAKLNLVAGKRAKASSAYTSALTYFTAGAALLPEDAWQHQQELAFELELHQTDCEICTGALQAAEERLATLATRAAGTLQRCAVARRRVDLYAMLGDSDQAVAVGLESLRHVGIDWPVNPTKEQSLSEYNRIWTTLGSGTIEDIIDLPLMQDPEALATLDVLTVLTVPTQYTDGNLHALVVSSAVNLCLERGNSDAAPASYAAMGVIAGALFGNHDEGYRLGKMACNLIERRGLKHFGAGRTYYNFAVLIPWTRPLRDGIDPARRAFQMGKEFGHPTFATLAARTVTSVLLASGHPLEQLECEAEEASDFVRPFGFFLDRVSALLALVRTLRGRTAKFGSLDDGQFAESSFEQLLTGHPTYAFLECYYWIRKLQARFFAGDYASAVDAADKAERWYETSVALSKYPTEMADFHFYAALSRAAQCQPTGPEPHATYQAALQRHEQQLRAWAATCPQNFEDRATLVGAEIARLEGRELDAERLYEAAIKSARAHEFVHNEALANELAARFYAERDFKMIANAYLREARSCYLRWGADGKVRQLEQLHPWLRQEERSPGQAGTIDAPVEQLDLATVIEVSQALSGEMVVEKLIDRFMRAAIAQAGAERALLIAVRGDELRTSAEAAVHGDEVTVQVPQHPAHDAVALPDSVIRYSIRTQEPVVLDDAMAPNPFSADPYIVTHHVRSVLTLPLINQGKPIGILYLENNLTPHVFTPGRVTVTKVLASQAAISLENTGLYRDLADREARIRRLWDSNILGICTWNIDGAVVSANDEFLRMLQYDQGDVAAGRLNWAELTPAEWREQAEGAMAALRTTGSFQPFEKEYLRKDGSRVPVLIGGALFEGEGNQGVAFVIDQSERKRAETALRESEERFRDYAETASDWLWEMGPDHKLTMLSGNAFGSSPVARLGTAAWERALDLETEPEKWRTIRATMDSHKPFRDFVYLAAGRDGSPPMYVKASGRPVFGSNGEFRGYRGTGTDVTAIIRAQEALRESERNLRAAMDGIPGLVGVLAPNGEVETVNRQILEYCGQSLEELRNWGTNGTIHPEDLPHVVEVFSKSIAAGIPYQIEQRLRRFDGEYRWFDNRGIPIRDDSGRITRWYVLLTDIEDRTRALARLQQMQSDFAHINRVSIMGELAASLSHEITQPIASARNNARAAQNFLNKQPPDLGEVSEALGCVVGDADRAGDIIGRIRDQIRKAPPRKDHFDLNAAVNEVIALARSAIIRNGVSVKTEHAEALSPLHGDRVQLQQVILNLVLNAVEAMGSVEAEARELLISTDQDHTGVRVAVRDTGPGIDPTHLERVFEAFYTTKSSGTGMGLSICRSIIDAHGGRLWAEANEPRGVVFQFTLPRAE
jgi:PAS domain S-box-containing protein